MRPVKGVEEVCRPMAGAGRAGCGRSCAAAAGGCSGRCEACHRGICAEAAGGCGELARPTGMDLAEAAQNNQH